MDAGGEKVAGVAMSSSVLISQCFAALKVGAAAQSGSAFVQRQWLARGEWFAFSPE